MTLSAKENFFKLGGKSPAQGFATMHAANAFKFTRAPGKSDNVVNDAFFTRYQSAGAKDFLGPLSNLLDYADGRVDMTPFVAARNAMSNITRELEAELRPVTPRRVRRMSEHDGEWDYARRFEVAPFQNSRREMCGMARTIDIEVCFQFCAGRDKEEISKFGALAFAVINAVESMGITTNLVNSFYTTGIVRKFPNAKGKTSIEVKKSGEYLDESLLARCYTVEAFRRCIFSLSVASCDVHDKEVDSGLGYPEKEKSSAGHGFLKLAPDFLDSSHTSGIDVSKLKSFLKKALGLSVGDTRRILTPPQAPTNIYDKEVVKKQVIREELAPKEPAPQPQTPDAFKDFPKGTMCRIGYGPEAGKIGRVFWTGLAKKSGTPRIGVRFDNEGRNVFMSLGQVSKI